MLHLKEIVNNKTRNFSEFLAEQESQNRLGGGDYTTMVNNSTSEATTSSVLPETVEGPREVLSGIEATYTLTSYTNDASATDISRMKWVFYIDGVKIEEVQGNFLRIRSAKQKQECTTDFMAITNDTERTKAIAKFAILYAKIEKTPEAKITIKFSKWLDNHCVCIEAYRNKPDLDPNKGYVMSTSITAQPEIIDIQWVNDKKLPLNFSDYSQDKFLKITSLGLKDKDIELELKDYKQLISEQVITYTNSQNNKAITIEGRETLKKITILAKDEPDTTEAEEIVFQVMDAKNNSNEAQLPELKLQAMVTQGELINTGAQNGKLIFAKFLDLYPTEKVVDTYFATKEKITIKGENDTTTEEIIYSPVKELSIGQKTYLVANGANLADKTVKLKIHEKAEDGKFKIVRSEDEHIKVCKPKADSDTTYTELTNTEGWIEAKIDKDTNQAIAELVMRPKPDKIVAEGETATLSLEGLKEALYLRENEEDTYIAPTIQARPNTLIPLIYNDKAIKITYPEIITINSGLISRDITVELTNCTYKGGTGVTNEAKEKDKSNIRWALHFPDIQGSKEYITIVDRTTEAADSSTDFTGDKTQLEAKGYLYASTQIVNGQNKLTLKLSKYLADKKVHIEAFRGSPDLKASKGYAKEITLVKYMPLVKKLTTNLFVEALCEETTEANKIELINKKKITNLYVKDWYDPLERMELRGWYGPGSITWAPERSGYLPSTIYRNSGKHEGLDLYSPVGTTVYACLDGEVYMNYPSTTYGNCFGVKGKYKGTVYYFFYAHLNKKPSLKIGDKVNGGDPIGKTGISGNASSDLKKAHLHFEVRNTDAQSGGRLDTTTTIPDILKNLNTNPKNGSQPW